MHDCPFSQSPVLPSPVLLSTFYFLPSPFFALRYPYRRPRHHLQVLRKMQKRFHIRQPDPQRRRHRVHPNLRPRRLQRPKRVMDIPPINLPPGGSPSTDSTAPSATSPAARNPHTQPDLSAHTSPQIPPPPAPPAPAAPNDSSSCGPHASPQSAHGNTADETTPSPPSPPSGSPHPG